MPIIDWLDSYSVRDSELDENHRQIIEMVNTLHDSLLRNQVDETVSNVLKQLTAYSRTHLEAEEKVMRKMGFPDLNDHREMHREFSDRVAALTKTGAKTTVFELMGILREKLVKHILQEDRKLEAIIKEAADPADSSSAISDDPIQKMLDSRSRAS